MSHKRKGKRFFFITATLFCLFLLTFECPSRASDPHSAYYSSDNDKIFWFIITSDVHIGAKDGHGNDHLDWIVSEARQVIDPAFIVCAGDLTDSTNESLLGYPDGPHTCLLYTSPAHET